MTDLTRNRPPTADERAQGVIDCINGMTFDSGDNDDWGRKVKPVIARAIRKAEEIEGYEYEGAMADLESLLKAVIARLNGEKSLESLAEFIRLNYPEEAKELRA